MDMKKGKFLNPNNRTLDPKLDAWILAKRDAILEWYDNEMLKPDYVGASDEDMLALVARQIEEGCAAEPIYGWDNVICEVAEGILDLDEWTMGHYDIEEWLLDNTKWRIEDYRK